MMTTNEEKRWLVVGIVINKVVAPVLQDYIKHGMDTHYTNLDTYCSRLAPPCTLTTLTYHQVKADGNLKKLKFQNINNNPSSYGKVISPLYNYSINDSVQLAKLYLPDYLAKFSAFDESLDISAMLRLLGFSKSTPIFPSPNPFIPIQYCADDVRDNVRNKWGHCKLSDWTETFFKDCFIKLETLVRSLGLTGGKEKSVLDELSDWQTKGCQLCMGHAVDQQLLSLVRQDVKDLSANYVKTQTELSILQELVAGQTTEQFEMQGSISSLRDEHAAVQVHLQEHGEQIEETKKWIEEQSKETMEVLEKLQAAEKSFREEICTRVQQAETRNAESNKKVQQLESNLCDTNVKLLQLQGGLAKTDGKVEELEQRLTETDGKVKELEKGRTETNMKVEQLQGGLCDKVKELELFVRDQGMKPNVMEHLSVEGFDVETCRSKLAEHYRRTATVPTSVWSKKSPVDMQKIYTRLTWVKLEQTPEGSSNPELNHYTEVFDENESGCVPNRILVQGETGIGKTTFVKKMGLDWAELVDEITIDKQCQDAGTSFKAEGSVTLGIEAEPPKEEYIRESATDANALKRFELVLVINLKEVSKYSSLRDVICRSNIFPEEDKTMAEQLLNYIPKNQAKVLLVFDGYDEYHCGMNSEIYEIFKGHKLRNCCVLMTTRISKADDLREFKDAHAEITGFNRSEGMAFMCKMLGGKTEAEELWFHLIRKELLDLARIPLLLLFFCTLWKKGKLKSFPETKTKLYYAIVQYILDHNHGKGSPARFHKVDKYKDILVEIGKVALECLLRDDHVFEFDQLPASIVGEENHIIGLFQVTEFSENLRPAGMVSFIHKSIQEFLAAWYITYGCDPYGDLGELGDKARTLKDCVAFENIFQFICGLSNEGAVKVFKHVASVRIHYPELDLSKTMEDVINERHLTMPCLSIWHNFLNKLVYNCFQEAQCKAQLLRHCIDCTGGIVLVTRQVTEVLKKAKLQSITDFLPLVVLFLFPDDWDSCERLSELSDCLECRHIPLRSTETFTLGDFLVHYQRKRMDHDTCHCRFTPILLFSNYQFHLYVTSATLSCVYHVQVFMENVITHKCLNSITLECVPDRLHDILELVTNPSLCKVKINGCADPDETKVLQRFTYILRLCICFAGCSASDVEVLVTSVNPKFLEEVLFVNMRLTLATATALGRFVSEMSSLVSLELSGADKSALQDEEMKALFGGFNRRLPLRQFCFSRFETRVGLYHLIKSLQFFRSLQNLELKNINIYGDDLFQLLRSLVLMPSLEVLIVESERQRQPESCSMPCREKVDSELNFTHNALRILRLKEIELTSAAAAALGRLIPEMSSLEELTFTSGKETSLLSAGNSESFQSIGKDGIILQAGQVEALFGRVYKPLPLQKLNFFGFTVKGCLAAFAESFRFFPNLQTAIVKFDFIINDNNFPGFLERLKYISPLRSIWCEAVTQAGFAEEDNTVGRLKMDHGSLYLYDIALTPRAASTLGRLCPEMPSLQEFVFTGKDGNVLKGKDMEALFGKIHKELSLRVLDLNKIIITPEAAAALGRLLPRLSSLKRLMLTGADGSVLSVEEVEALFGGLNTKLPLVELSFRRFCMTGCLAPISKCLQFLPHLQYLTIDEVNVNEHNFFHLLFGMKYVPNLKILSVEGKSQTLSSLCSEKLAADVSFSPDSLQSLVLGGINLTPKAVAALGQLLSRMSSLEYLSLMGMDGTLLEEEEEEEETNNLFRARSCLAPLTDHLRCIPGSTKLMLDVYMSNTDFDLCGFLDNDLFLSSFISGLHSLWIECNALTPAVCNEEVNSNCCLKLERPRLLKLLDVNLTPAVASAIGRALCRMSSLNKLSLITENHGETILSSEKVDALFGGFQETLPLQSLFFTGFRVRGCLVPLAKSLSFFPHLRSVNLDVVLNSDDLQDFCGFLENVRCLKSMSIQCEARVYPDGREEADAMVRLQTSKSAQNLSLSGITLTPESAAVLGRSFCEMSSLETLILTGGDKCILNAEDINLLFGGCQEVSPLRSLTLRGFFVRGFFVPLAKSLSSIPDVNVNIYFDSDDVHSMCVFLESLSFVKSLKSLMVQCAAATCSGSENIANTGCHLVTSQVSETISLIGFTFTPGAAAALGPLLCRMSSLETLELIGSDGSIINAEELEALFGGFQDTFPLRNLTFTGFRITGCVTPLTASSGFFPDSRDANFDVSFNSEDVQSVCGFVDRLRFTKRFDSLTVRCETVASRDHADDVNTVARLTTPLFYNRVRLIPQILLSGISLTPVTAAALGQSLSQMPFLKTLEFVGRDGCIISTEEIEALFGSFQETLPLKKLTFTGFKMRGFHAPLPEGFSFFPDFHILNLYVSFSLDDMRNVCGFLESLRFMKTFESMRVQECKAVACADDADGVNTKVRLTSSESSRTLLLSGITLTPEAASVLGQSLCEMSSLKTLELTGRDGCVLYGEQIEVLFSGFQETSPLSSLTLRGFYLWSCPASLATKVSFFPDLDRFDLEVSFNQGDLQNVCGFLENLRVVKWFNTLHIKFEAWSDSTDEVITGVCLASERVQGVFLGGITLTPVAAAVLGQSLCEMSSLKTLIVTGAEGCILNAEEIEALFGGFNTTASLRRLGLIGFNMRGHLAPFTGILKLFPSLTWLLLVKLNIDEHDLDSLLQSISFISNVVELDLSYNPLGQAVKSIAPHLIKLSELCFVDLRQTASTEDLTYVKETLQRLQPHVEVAIV